MPSSANIRAGRAYVELSIENSALVRGLKAAQKRLRGFASSVTDVGKRMVVASTVMAAPLVGGVKVYADFEQQMANVSTMLSEPEKHMPRFRESIRDMSVEFGEGTDTLAKGLYDILSASIPAEHALDVLAVSSRAAKAGITDTGVAADAITTILNAYGLEANQAGSVSDWLFSVVRRGKTVFAELAPSIGMVATTAASAGVPLDEMGAALATMTRNGVRTENAVTALNAIVSSFLSPSAEAAEYARSLGFEMSSATIQSEGLAGVFERISQLPPDAVAKLFPNVRALRGVLPALKNMEGFGEDLAAMAGRAGATGEAYDKMTKTLTHSFAQLKQAVLVVLSVMGEALAEPVERATKALTRYAKMMRELIQNNQGLVITAVKVVAVVGAIGGALVAVGSAASVLAFAFGGLASIGSAVATAIGIIGSILGAILTPAGLVTAAIVALGGYLVYASGLGGRAIEWLGEQFGRLRETAQTAFGGIRNALAAGDLQLAAKVLWTALKLEWTRGIGVLSDAWAGMTAWLAESLSTAWYGILSVVKIVANAVANVWDEALGSVGRAQDSLADAMLVKWYELQVKMGRMTDEELAARKAYIEAETRGRQDSQAAEQRKSREQRIAELADIGQESGAVSSEIQAERDRKRAENERRLAEARGEFQAALEEARSKRAAVGEEGGEQPGANRIESLMERLRDAAPGVADARRALEVRGTFNAANLLGLLTASSTEERTAKASEKTAKNTERMLRELEEGGAAFA